MAFDQALAFAVLAATMVLFIWGRLRYDLVAVLALLAAVFTGIVPYSQAFSGFSDDIVIIVASALIVSAAVARSGVMEAALKKVSPLRDLRAGSDCAARHGSHHPVGLRQEHRRARHDDPGRVPVARRSKASPSCFLMPMAFGSLLGGLITLVGTSPNIIVSRLRERTDRAALRHV